MNDGTAAPRIHSLFEIMVKQGASDLHMTSGFQPFLRTSGDMVSIESFEVLTPELNRELLYAIMPEKNRLEYEERWDTDFGHEVAGLGRFRANIFNDSRGIGAVFRLIPSKILTADDLKLPKAARDLCNLSKGLVVVTGPTGSGKSTTLAAMIDLINKTRADHIITIEDPIEFVHRPQKCLINQREVHSQTRSFANALRAALREDPDIVLVGEMRDLETVEIALETAETGHLVFGTLHTSTAASTVDRIIDKFPADRQNQIRTMLAGSLKGVIAQTLLKKIGGGRVAALEILLATTAVSSNIRDGKTHQIMSAMQTGKSIGMQMLSDELFRLTQEGIVTAEEALLKSTERTELTKKLELAGLLVAPPPPPAEDEGAAAEPATRASNMTRAVLRGDDHTKQVAQLRDELRRKPNSPETLNNLAWILATTRDPQLRQLDQALEFASRAYDLTEGQNPAILDTLAAVYAAREEYESAVSTARYALDLALSRGDQELARSTRLRLNGYEKLAPVRALRVEAPK